MKFNEKLIELRKKHGISQEELGNKINVSRQAISKWESEQAKPEVDKIKEISKTFNVSIEYLLNDELNEDIKINKTKNKKKIKKIILILLLVIISIYLTISFYKLGILFIYNIKINNIPDYENYTRTTNGIVMDTLRNEYFELNETQQYSNGIKVAIEYNKEYEKDSHISYIDYKNKISYLLSYDSEMDKYIYINSEKLNEDNLDILYTNYGIKDDVKSMVPSEIVQILLFAFNPQTRLKFIDGNLCIISNSTFASLIESDNQSFETYIDKDGFINKFIITDTENNYYSKYDYCYCIGEEAIDMYYINQEYLNDLEYVMEEESIAEEY